MKVLSLSIFLFSTLLASSSAWASLKKAQRAYQSNLSNKNEIITYQLIKSKYYFSAIQFAINHIEQSKKISSEFEKALQILMLKTGTATFRSLPVEILKQHSSPSLSLTLGLKYFKNKKFKQAIQSLDKIPKDHRFYPEAKMVQASSLSLTRKYSSALKSYDQCIEHTEAFINTAGHKKLKRYYTILKESCLIHKARIYYTNKRFKKSLDIYNSIEKTSYRWPYLLLEKAWANYYLEDYNRSLGLLVTYKSPLLSSYFFPEAEALTSLNYFKLCLYDDSLLLIDQYYKVYKERSDQLKSILVDKKNSHSYFLKLVFSPINKSEKKNPYIRNLVTQIRKKVKFSLDLITLKRAQAELKALKKKSPSAFNQLLIKQVRLGAKWRSRLLNHFVKKHMFKFINSIHKFSYEMFSIKLEIMSKKRELVYQNKKLSGGRSRGSLSHVNKRNDQHLWRFKGAFWADELGDYSFGLGSRCQDKGAK